MYTESWTSLETENFNRLGNFDIKKEESDVIVKEAAWKLDELRKEIWSSLLPSEEWQNKINVILSSLSREEQIAVLRSFSESQQQIEKNLTEIQKARIEQVEIFSTLLTWIQTGLQGESEGTFSGVNLWLSNIFQWADIENLKQFLEKFDPIDVSNYIIQNKDATLYSYMTEKYPGQIDMFKRITFHSWMPFNWIGENGLIFSDVKNTGEVLKYRTEIVRFFRSSEWFGSYNISRIISTEWLRGKFDEMEWKIDKKKITEETEQEMKKNFWDEWEKTTIQALKESSTHVQKTEDELKTIIATYRENIRVETLKQKKEKAIGEMIFDTDNFSTYSAEEKELWNEYSDSMGFGFLNAADETWDSIATELAINAPLILASGWVANVAIKWLSKGANAIVPQILNRMGKSLGKNILGRTVLKTAQMAISMGVEWTVFEMAHHALSKADLNMFNEPGWQSKILWSSITLGAFKWVGKVQQSAMMKSFAEKISTGAGNIAHLKWLNTVLQGFPVGLQAGFGKIIAGMSAFEGARQLETSVMFLTGAAQATLWKKDLDNFYANLYDYCVANGGENYFHAMVSAHALNLAHNGASELGRKIKDKLWLKKSPDKPGSPDKAPDKNNAEVQQILSGELLPAIQKEIKDAWDKNAQDTKRIEIAERMIQKLRWNTVKLTDAEKKIIIDVHNMPASGPDGTYTPKDIAARAIKLTEIFTWTVWTMWHAIREALIRNGICGTAEVMDTKTYLDQKGKVGILLDWWRDTINIAGKACVFQFNKRTGELEISAGDTVICVSTTKTSVSNSSLRSILWDIPSDISLSFDWKADGQSVTVKKTTSGSPNKPLEDNTGNTHTLDTDGKVWIAFENGAHEINIAGRPFEFIYDSSSWWFSVFAKDGQNWAKIEQNRTKLSNETLKKIDPQFPEGVSLTFEWKEGHIVIKKVSWEQVLQSKKSPEQSITRNTTLKPITEVPRSVTIDIMGDTHWSYEGYLANLKSLWIINSAGKFTGSKTRIVLVGDILWDRNTGSMDTYRHIDWLKKQWADIQVLAGNHEDFVIGFLTDGNHAWSDALAQTLRGQWEWLLEFGRFVDPNLQSINPRTFPDKKDILTAMRDSTKGRQILEQMCQMKLGEHIDDTLFVHTDPTAGMINMIQKYWIDKINQIFQANMRASLLEGKELKTEPSFETIRDVFLHTENGRSEERPPMTENQWSALRSAWINRIIHGHTNHNGQHIRVWWVEVHSVDNGAFRRWVDDGRRSVGRIETNGWLSTSSN